MKSGSNPRKPYKAALPVEYGRHVVWVDADHVAHQHAGQVGNVVVGAVNNHGQAVGYTAVKRPDAGLGLSLEPLANNATGADQHQAVDHFGYARCSAGAVDVHQGVFAGFGQVGSDGRAITRCAGDQRVERRAPGVHRMWDQLDLFDRALRLVRHCGVPRC